MSDTQKIEKPSRRDSGKLPLSLQDLLSRGLDSSFLRIVAIIVAGGGGERIMQQLGNPDAKWWMIAAGLGTWWLVGEVRQIKQELRMSSRRSEANEEEAKRTAEETKRNAADIAALKAVQELHAKEHRREKSKSKDRIDPHPPTGGVPMIEPIGG
jgi:hypothetical protein